MNHMAISWRKMRPYPMRFGTKRNTLSSSSPWAGFLFSAAVDMAVEFSARCHTRIDGKFGQSLLGEKFLCGVRRSQLIFS